MNKGSKSEKSVSKSRRAVNKGPQSKSKPRPRIKAVDRGAQSPLKELSPADSARQMKRQYFVKFHPHESLLNLTKPLNYLLEWRDTSHTEY